MRQEARQEVKRAGVIKVNEDRTCCVSSGLPSSKSRFSQENPEHRDRKSHRLFTIKLRFYTTIISLYLKPPTDSTFDLSEVCVKRLTVKTVVKRRQAIVGCM